MKKKTFRILAMLFVAVCLLSSFPAAAQVRKGANKKTAKVTSRQQKKPSSEELYQKGWDYWNGENGVSMNREKAYELWLEAAQKGHAKAQGKCTENDNLSNEERVNWARKSAEQGYWLGMLALSDWYENGEMGLPKDDAQSVFWDMKWAETGEAAGQCCYGLDLIEGRGGRAEDVSGGIFWLEKAAEQDDLTAVKALKEMYVKGYADYGYKKVICQKDAKKYIKWLRKASELGHIDSQFELAKILIEENNKMYDPEQAYFWLLKVMEKSSSGDKYFGEVCFVLACIEQDNHNDYEKAVEWLRKGADAGHPSCQYFLAEDILKGKIKQSFEGEAIQLLEKVSKQDVEPDMRDYAKAELNGSIVLHIMDLIENKGFKPKSKEAYAPTKEKLDYIIKQAELGNARAQSYYAIFLLGGCKKLGIKQNTNLAKYYIKEAIKKQDWKAYQVAQAFESCFHESIIN